MRCAAGLLSNLPDAVLCAELAQPGTETARYTDTSAAETARPHSAHERAADDSLARPWLLLTDGILQECCAAMAAGADSGNVYSHVHQLRTMTACLGRIARALQVPCRPYAVGSLELPSMFASCLVWYGINLSKV